MAQPNFQNLSQHLIGVGQEIANLPVLNVNAQLHQINQQLQQLVAQMAANQAAINNQFAGVNNQFAGVNAQFGALNAQVGALNGQVAQLAIAQDLLPMRLQNASSSTNAQLRYPAGFVVVALAPVIKQDLLSLNVAACQATAQALGLPPLVGNPTVIQRRQQVIDFLGAALTA